MNWKAEGYRVYDAHGFVVCEMVGSDAEQNEAYSKMIAAAPEMLGALNTLRIILSPPDRETQEALSLTLDDALARMDAAIAKADGRQ